MKTEIGNLLDAEIEKEIADLSSLSPGSKEKSDAVNDLAKLYKLRVEEREIELKHLDEATKNGETSYVNEQKNSLENAELAERKKDRIIKTALDAAGVVLPLAFYAVWMRRGLKFEETGTFTSATFKGLLNRFRPTK